jgi:hypothetical protein
VVFTAAGIGSSGYDYQFWLNNGAGWIIVQDYGNGPTWTLPASTPLGNYTVTVYVRTSTTVTRDAYLQVGYTVRVAPATGVTLTPDQASPHNAGTPVVFVAAGIGSSGYDYQFWLNNGAGWTVVQDYGNGASWTLPASTPAGSYTVTVYVRTSATVTRDAYLQVGYTVN